MMTDANSAEGFSGPKPSDVPIYRTTVLPTAIIVLGLVIGSPINVIAGIAAGALSFRFITHGAKFTASKPFARAGGPITKAVQRMFVGIAVVFTIGCLISNLAAGADLACSSSGAQDLVAQIYREKNSKWLTDAGQATFNGADLEFQEVRTVSKEADPEAVTCMAKIHTDLPAGAEKQMSILWRQDAQVEYRLTRTDDGRLYAQVR